MTKLLTQAHQLISELQEHFQVKPAQTRDELLFQSYLTDTLKALDKTKQVDNQILISLEKFHKSASSLIGLSSLKLDEASYQAWRNFDRFHSEEVLKELKLFGPYARL